MPLVRESQPSGEGQALIKKLVSIDRQYGSRDQIVWFMVNTKDQQFFHRDPGEERIVQIKAREFPDSQELEVEYEELVQLFGFEHIVKKTEDGEFKSSLLEFRVTKKARDYVDRIQG